MEWQSLKHLSDENTKARSVRFHKVILNWIFDWTIFLCAGFHEKKSVLLRVRARLVVLHYPTQHTNSVPVIIGFKLAGLGSRSEPGVFGSLEPEPLEKKGAGAAWKKSQEPEPVKN